MLNALGTAGVRLLYVRRPCQLSCRRWRHVVHSSVVQQWWRRWRCRSAAAVSVSGCDDALLWLRLCRPLHIPRCQLLLQSRRCRLLLPVSGL